MSERSSGYTGGPVFVGLGGLLAALMSFMKWHSIFFALIHGFLCGWFYVIYSLIRYGVPQW